MSKFSNNIKKLRLDHNLTQNELALKLGVSKSTISMYENGNRTPDFEMLESIADFFNVSIDSLIGAQNKVSGLSKESSDETEIRTLAAHAVGDLTEEDMKKIIEYAKFIKSQHTQK